MNRCIQAECRSGTWHLVQTSAQDLSSEDRALVRASLQHGREKAHEMYRNLGSISGVWQLELSKAVLDEGEIALGLAEQFAQQCCANPTQIHRVRAGARHLSLRSLVFALQARGQSVAWSWRYSILDRVQFALAMVVAGVFWLVTLLRSIGESGALPKRAECLIAAHGEWTNRTRHVLAWQGQGQGQGLADSTIIVLGRPKVSLKALERHWSKQLGCGTMKLVRPFSGLAAALSLPHAAEILFRGLCVIGQQPYTPRFSELVAIAYRCFLGAASARWWLDSGSVTEKILYGHTGLADTTLLEQAQQKCGAKTIHVVHGISAGLNFTGHSSVALFRCAHDVRWHQQLGGYGLCRSDVADRPASVRGVSGLLFLSNHLHPMNPWFRAFGPVEELKALSILAEAADELGVARCEVVWKPHPVFNTLEPSVQQAVVGQIQRLGFTQWPEGSPLGGSTGFQYVVCTRSTVALDVLKLGVLPLILDTRLEETHDVMSNFPYQADTADGLSRAARMLMAGAAEAFTPLWDAVGPAIVLAGPVS